MPAAVVACSNALLLIPSMCMLGSSTARCTEWDGIALPAIAQAFGRRAGRRHDARARVVVPSPPWLAAHSRDFFSCSRCHVPSAKPTTNTKRIQNRIMLKM